MKYNRFLPLLTPLVILFLFEWYFFSHKMIYVCSVFVVLLIFFTVWQFSKASSVNKKWWNFMFLPAVFAVSIIFYSTIIASAVFVQLLFILYLIFLYLYLRVIYYYLLQPMFYKENSLENAVSYGSFFSFFFFSSATYGLISFLNASVWILMLLLSIVSSIIIYQLIWINKIDFKKSILYLAISCFVAMEIAWSISFLPISFNISGLLLSICFYVFFNLLKHDLRDNLDDKIVKRYLLFGFLGIFIVLLTSRWM